MNARGPFDPEPSASAPRPGVGADQALAGLRVNGPGARGGLDRFRLGPAAAGALRAAVDCLVGDDARAPLQAMADEAAFELRFERVDPNGLDAAGHVLETVEGNLAPTPGGAGSWSLRLPLLTSRETFLMIERGGVALALPWHAVTRVRMASAGTLAGLAAREGVPVLSPLGLGGEGADEGPAVLIGLGLKRAYLLADRLVWRMTAEPHEPPLEAPDPRLGPALRAGEDGVYWMLDPATLLRDVALPPLPHAGALAAETAPPVESPVPPPARATLPAPAPARVADEDTRSHPRPRLRLVELTEHEVDPLDDEESWDEPALEPHPIEPEAAPETAPAATTTPAPGPLAPGPPAGAPATHLPAPAPMPLTATRPAPRVLVAEDSITACIFLERLLQQRGFAVRTVGTARELREWLARERWDLVFADVDLPDAHGADWLRELAPRRGDGAPAPLVALVRDDEDAGQARAAGVPLALRKPFEREDLAEVLAAVGTPRDPSRRV